MSTVFLFTSLALAETNSDATIQALLVEVKQLRLALERSAVVAPKIQVTLQRIQLQQEQVSRMSRQSEDLRDRLAQTALDNTRVAAEIKQADARLTQEPDAARRKVLEEEIRAATNRLEMEREQRAIHEASQRARESDLSDRLRTEQAKLDELNERLNALERLLESPPAKP
jgi:hypothetical protein